MENKAKSSVIGQFTGKCCDSNVMNNNDMHLGRELFENLLESDEYKMAMENHHYMGYLGHPDNPDCQEFQNACIVMKDMRILDNGEIEGDFDLVDTPVGRVVKSFIDAGVKFGISIRGLGDVDGNGEVDPEGFIFRGFDLVAFPAYDDCIPEFKAIAASTDAKKKAAYKKVCASIDANLPDISSPITLGVIQEQLTEGSDEFDKVQERIDELTGTDESQEDASIELQVTEEKLEAMTDLYLDAAEKARELEEALVECQAENAEIIVECTTLKNRYARFKKIAASQLATAKNSCEDLENRNLRLSERFKSARSSLADVKASLADTKKELSAEINANTKLQSKVDSLTEQNEKDMRSIEASNNLNLKYKQKIEANSETISQKDSAIEDLKNELNETVVANQKLEAKASNLDEKCSKLLSRVEAAEEMVMSYQQAYANMYANALGVYLKDLPVTANTTVEDLKNMITAGTSTANIPAGPDMYDVDEEFDEPIEGEEEFEDDTLYNAGMVTI